MYYYIKGKVAEKGADYIVVESGGIGYVIYTSFSTLSQVKNTGDNIILYTHLHVREDVMDLYGFATKEEKSMFLHLMSVSGVGPKAALAILSVTTPAKFAIAVMTGDVKTLTKAKGIGPKAAQRVILELKDKLKKENIDTVIDEDTDTDNRGEAVSALVVLGYSVQDAKDAVRKTKADGNVEDIIKEALKALMK